MTDAATITVRSPLASARQYFRKPKGLLILMLLGLVLLAATGPGAWLIARSLAVAMGVAMLVDAPVLRGRKGRWEFPDGALLTGMIVAMILSVQVPWWVVAVTSVFAVLSKYALRTRTANIFNPAALALVMAFLVFHSGQDWWGALPEITPLALVVLIAAGAFVTHRVNKLPALLAFLGSYFLLFTVTAFLGDPARVAELYRPPDLHAVLFFGFVMVTDPPTSPPRHRDQIVFGVIVAAVSYAVFQLVGAAYFLLAGLLVGNAWEAWRRARVHAGRHAGGRATHHGTP